MSRSRPPVPPRDVQALAASLLFIAIGFGAIVLVAKVADVKDGVVLATLLILPSVLYLLLSGRVSDFKGPGGLELKLAEVAQQPIPMASNAGGSNALAYERIHQVPRGRAESFVDHIKNISTDDPVVLTLTLGSGEIDGTTAADYARGLTQFPRFRFVAVVDPRGQLVSYMPERGFRHLVESDLIDTNRLLGAIGRSDIGAVRAYPGMITSTLGPTTSIADSLRELERLRTDAMLVTSDGEIHGIVERDRIANALLLSLVDARSG